MIAQSYNKASVSFAGIQFLFVLLVGSAKLFRISESLNLKIKDISIGSAGMSIFFFSKKE